MSTSRPALSVTDDAFAERLSATLAACAKDVFETMVGRALTEVGRIAGDALRPTGDIVGTVGLTGPCSGLVMCHLTYGAAREVTVGLLATGAPESATRDEVVGAMGDVTSMIAGSFRTRLAMEGDTWAITIPTVTLGSDFCIKPVSSGARTLLPFRMDHHDVVVELLLTRRVARA